MYSTRPFKAENNGFSQSIEILVVLIIVGLLGYMVSTWFRTSEHEGLHEKSDSTDALEHEPPELEKAELLTQLDRELQEHIAANRLSTGRRGNALQTLFRMETLNAPSGSIQQGKVNIANRYAELADAAINRRELDEAASYIAKGKNVTFTASLGQAAADLLKVQLTERNKQGEAANQKPKFQAVDIVPGKIFRDQLKAGGTGPEMVVIPAGSFRMGDLNGNVDNEEKPVHKVTISADFAMGRFEVTFDEYDRFTSAMGRINWPSSRADDDLRTGNRPLSSVSFPEAKEYANWLSEQTGRHYRLPSEAEWEYAARGLTESKYDWGNQVGRNRANCAGCGSHWDDQLTAPVGSFQPNSFGLYDFHGNVSEWTEDCWHETYLGAPKDGRSWLINCTTSERVIRGGSWITEISEIRSASRWGAARARGGLWKDLGIRLAADLN